MQVLIDISKVGMGWGVHSDADKESIWHKLLSGVVALQARSGAIQAAIDTLMATMERVGGLSASLASRLEEAEQHVATEIVNREKAGKERALNRTAPIERLDTKKLRQRIVEEDHGKLEVRPTPHPTPHPSPYPRPLRDTRLPFRSASCCSTWGPTHRGRHSSQGCSRRYRRPRSPRSLSSLPRSRTIQRSCGETRPVLPTQCSL